MNFGYVKIWTKIRDIQLTMSYRSSNVTTQEIYKGPTNEHIFPGSKRLFYIYIYIYIYICMYLLNTSVQSFKITRPNY